MSREPLDHLPLWLLFLAVCLLTALALECGYRLGKWRHYRVIEEKETPVGAMAASILGLLAFLLAFTFGMAGSRFDDRRHTVLDEANAIGTTYLRTRFLPEPQRTTIAEMLREYVDVRIRGIQERELAKTIQRSEELQEAIWKHTVAAAEKDSHSIMTGLFIQSLNEMIDLHAKRIQVGTRSRVPIVIWIGLITLSILGIAALGYQSGLSMPHRSPAMVGMIFAFAGVLYLIADLDRGHEGLLTVSQQAMIDLQKSMHTQQP